MSASAKRSGPVRVALVGAGLFAQEHARALSKLQAQGKVLVDLKVVEAICDAAAAKSAAGTRVAA